MCCVSSQRATLQPLTHYTQTHSRIKALPPSLPPVLTSLQEGLGPHCGHEDDESQDHAHVCPKVLLRGQFEDERVQDQDAGELFVVRLNCL